MTAPLSDVSLYNALEAIVRDEAAVRPEVLTSLASLTTGPLIERLPVLLWARALLAHPSADLRAHVAAALGGTNGIEGIRLLAELSKSPTASVAAAAAEALRASSEKHPEVFALGAFHADPEVRKIVARAPLPAGCDEVAFALAVDPACAALIPVACPPRATTVVLAWQKRGRISVETAQRWLAEVGLRAILTTGLGPSPRSETELRIAAAGGGRERADPLDDVFALFSAGDPTRVSQFFAAAAKDLSGRDAGARLRVAASTRIAMARAPSCLELVGMHVVLSPETLLDPELPLTMRRKSLLCARRFAARPFHRASDELVDELLRSELVDHDALDLELLAALADFATRPYRALTRMGSAEAVALAVGARPHEAASLFSLDDPTAGARASFIASLSPYLASMPSALAVVLFHVEPDAFSLLADLDRSVLEAALKSMAALERAGTRIPERFSHRAFGAAALSTLTRAAEPSPSDDAALGVLALLEDTLDTTMASSLLGVVAERLGAEPFASWLLARTPLLPWLTAIAASGTFDWPLERLLSSRLSGHSDPLVRAWAEDRAPRAFVSPAAGAARALTTTERAAIRSASDADLAHALAPALAAPVTGVVEPLAMRMERPSVAAVVALAMSRDGLVDVARQADRFGAPDEAFLERIIAHAAQLALGRQDLGVAAHAFLARWEKHTFLLLDHLVSFGALDRTLALIETLPGSLVAGALFGGLARAFGILHARDPARLSSLVHAPLAAQLTAMLGGPYAAPAAQLLGSIADTPVLRGLLDPHRGEIIARLPDLSELSRFHLQSVAVVRVAPAYARPPRGLGDTAELLRMIRSSNDQDRLVEHARDPREEIANEAAVRLVMLGKSGEARILALLAGTAKVPWARALATAVGLFSDARVIGRAATLLDPPHQAGPLADAEVRFALAAALFGHGHATVGRAIEAVTEETAPGWLRPQDVEWLIGAAGAGDAMRALAVSPHPHAYLRAVPVLLERGPRSAADRAALRAFLDRGRSRESELRARVAYALLSMADRHGFVVAVEEALKLGPNPRRHLLLRHDMDAAATRIVEAVLLGGDALAHASAVLAVFEELPAGDVRTEVHLRLVRSLRSPSSRQQAAGRLGVARQGELNEKLAAIAEVFVWGMREGLRLTGKRFAFHPILDDGLGHTFLTGRDIHVSPVPLWDAVPHGKEIVEGLVLHELGHHVHHAEPEARALWDQAVKEGYARLLNVVLDEHLERNLRAEDDTAGDRLKRLGAWAFRHRRRAIPIERLLGALGPSAFDVLHTVALWPALRDGEVEVEAGAVLAALEAEANAFARFFSALRLGLGNRWSDPKVEAGLALFTKSFRKLDMPGLVDVTLRLREIFSDEILLTQLAAGHEDQESPDGVGSGEGITDQDVQREVKRILGRPPPSSGRGSFQPAINVSPDETFPPIHHVTRVPFDAAAHAKLATEVRRHTLKLRETLERLGLRMVPTPPRLSGKRIDRTRLMPLILRADPHILLARQVLRDGDLFLGLAIDCSGSMQGASIARARRFGVLLAEATRGLSSVDLRIFGFNERTLFDAGDAERCAVASLNPTSGNNDAAALDHVVRLARASRRRGRLVVMISDGLPTECSVAALRSVVQQASRQQVACAQVAVRPLTEIAFPHYVEIKDGPLDGAVARFSQIVSRLVGRTLTP